MVQIEKDNKRIRWHKIKAEYIAGASQRMLAEKYKVSRTSVAKHCRNEGWSEERKKAEAKVTQEVIRKTADEAADNAVIAERIKTKLLRRLEREIDHLPESIGSEMFQNVQNLEYDGNRVKKRTDGGKTYKLKDLTAAYKDLTADMVQTEQSGNELLQSLLDLERRAES